MKALSDLARLLLAIESAAGPGSGSLRIYGAEGPEALGTVWLEGREVCWAEARGAPLGLVDLVLRRSGWSRQRLSTFCQHAQAAGRPVLALLLESSGLDAGNLRELVLLHLEVALASFAAVDDRPLRLGNWEPAPASAHSIQHSFSAIELLASLVESEGPASPQPVPPAELFLRVAPSLSSGICFLVTGGPELPAIPIRAVGMGSLGLGRALKLYRAALRLARPPLAGAHAVRPFAVLVRQGGLGWLVAAQPPFLCLFRVSNPGDYGLLLSALRSERAPAGPDPTLAGMVPSRTVSSSRPAAWRSGHYP